MGAMVERKNFVRGEDTMPLVLCKFQGIPDLVRCHPGSIAAMFVNGSVWLILLDMSLLRCAIWLWMYSRNVSDLHRPCFMIVVSLWPVSLRAMAPPARRECTPTRSGAIPTF